MTFTMPDPPRRSYPWKTGKQIFGYPLMTVFADTKAEADEIAGDDAGFWTNFPYRSAFMDLCLDSIEAQDRLGIFGRSDLLKEMCRGE